MRVASVFGNRRFQLQAIDLRVGVFNQVFEVTLLLFGLVAQLSIGLFLLAQLILGAKVVKEVRNEYRGNNYTNQEYEAPRRYFSTEQRWQYRVDFYLLFAKTSSLGHSMYYCIQMPRPGQI